MKKGICMLVLLFTCGCKTTTAPIETDIEKAHFTIAFGSCNKHDLKHHLWDVIAVAKPDLCIWGGDNVYVIIADMDQLYRV